MVSVPDARPAPAGLLACQTARPAAPQAQPSLGRAVGMAREAEVSVAARRAVSAACDVPSVKGRSRSAPFSSAGAKDTAISSAQGEVV